MNDFEDFVSAAGFIIVLAVAVLVLRTLIGIIFGKHCLTSAPLGHIEVFS